MGASQAEVLGRGWANSIHPDDRPRVVAAWWIDYGNCYKSGN